MNREIVTCTWLGNPLSISAANLNTGISYAYGNDSANEMIRWSFSGANWSTNGSSYGNYAGVRNVCVNIRMAPYSKFWAGLGFVRPWPTSCTCYSCFTDNLCAKKTIGTCATYINDSCFSCNVLPNTRDQWTYAFNNTTGVTSCCDPLSNNTTRMCLRAEVTFALVANNVTTLANSTTCSCCHTNSVKYFQPLFLSGFTNDAMQINCSDCLFVKTQKVCWELCEGDFTGTYAHAFCLFNFTNSEIFNYFQPWHRGSYNATLQNCGFGALSVAITRLAIWSCNSSKYIFEYYPLYADASWNGMTACTMSDCGYVPTSMNGNSSCGKVWGINSSRIIPTCWSCVATCTGNWSASLCSYPDYVNAFFGSRNWKVPIAFWCYSNGDKCMCHLTCSHGLGAGNGLFNSWSEVAAISCNSCWKSIICWSPTYSTIGVYDISACNRYGTITSSSASYSTSLQYLPVCQTDFYGLYSGYCRGRRMTTCVCYYCGRGYLSCFSMGRTNCTSVHGDFLINGTAYNCSSIQCDWLVAGINGKVVVAKQPTTEFISEACNCRNGAIIGGFNRCAIIAKSKDTGIVSTNKQLPITHYKCIYV